ncbi:hypothetical protein DOTSEDRAFT_69267 [Dothistroma septosporum NZE10]|uniref:Altered inheritance of mitochondria protein 32 n=1 Tax=Dothistroma septosporum (strain NZE10 / CBS 128990) TaxID=675120 RepID=N1PV63_DOTSN|nr:hypothetical protein DOTSEDRAFT_69267 [Dothistroma septosporum NZE10]
MFVFRRGGRVAASTIRPVITTAERRYATKIEIPFVPPPFPVVESCPSPTCSCREPPAGLDIEREQNISGSMATYAEQILISTGRNDWTSKIEDEEEAVLVRQLKKHLTRGGKYVDPYHNVMITNSSFPPTAKRSHVDCSNAAQFGSPSNPKTGDSAETTASAFLLPSFRYIPSISTNDNDIEFFIRAFMLPEKLHKSYSNLSQDQRDSLLRQPDYQKQFASRPVNEIVVLVCGHGGRDERCGKLGPILIEEFEEKLQAQNIAILKAPEEMEHNKMTARVGSISHIGGHKWAGNVIIYIPPSFKGNALAGKGIWYGRVGPEHVEGIVEETVMEGKVIKEFFRGGIDKSGEILRL